jgi:hypothetical protein
MRVGEHTQKVRIFRVELLDNVPSFVAHDFLAMDFGSNQIHLRYFIILMEYGSHESGFWVQRKENQICFGQSCIQIALTKH